MLKNELMKDLSIKNKKSNMEIAVKLVEETGEVSEAVLKMLGSNGMSYKVGNENLVDEVKEECVDVMMIALSLIYKLTGDNKGVEGKLEILKGKSELELVLLLSKATGELSEEILKGESLNLDKVVEKVSNVISLAQSLFYKAGGNKEEEGKILDVKLKKWQKVSQ